MKKIIDFFNKPLNKIIIGAVLLLSAIIVEKSKVATVSLVLYIAALLVSGLSVFIDAIKGLLRRDLLDEKFLMSIASVGAMIIGEFSEGVAVMLFYLIGETFEHIAVRKSRKSIKALMDFCPDEANLITEDGEERVDADELEIGSEIIIRPGERVPVDSVILSGEAELDTSSMTGEALPVLVRQGDSIDSGVIVVRGLLKAKTVKTADLSAAQRILELVENATDNKSKEESFITRFSNFYTPTVVILAFLLAIIPPIFRITTFSQSIYRALIFLVISCPCALVISVPMAFFGGIGGSASRGILFKGGNVFSKLKSADTIALDKTGTLTTGELSVKSYEAVDIDKEELFYLVSVTEYASNHPIAKCLKKLSDRSHIPESAEEFAGEGTVAEFDGITAIVGNERLMKRFGVKIPDGLFASVYVAKSNTFVGCFQLSDGIKSETKDVLSQLYSSGIKRQAILSGDKEENVLAVANDLDIKEAYYKLTPEEKYKKLDEMITCSNGGVIYVGDGINDAPSIARADVGIAMGGVGQDSAIESADVVIMTDELGKIYEARKIATKTLSIAKQNIVFALGIKILVMILGALGVTNMLLAVFADVGVAVLAILNSMRALSYSKRSKK